MTRDYVAINRDIWEEDASNWVETGERLWAASDPEWGNWGVPEAELGLLPDDLSGQDAIELGCGTAYVAGWMARLGACVTGIDISAAQLSTARRLAKRHDVPITLLDGNAEATTFADGSFDFAISEYGAAIWCRPDRWLTEAWRLLRPGGRLVFLGNHPLSLICTPENGAPCDTVIHRPYRGMWGADWTQVEFDPSGISFNLTVADWFALFKDIGFDVQNYQELYAPTHARHVRAGIPAEWAKRYPVEQVWHLSKGTA
ncbi:class I SAM-dependent methyltransferase [uncultured Roseobacter sp.]|uniref:class I SAM-dependent methyltransferase n=1 Tax=uncultured Roseobacter sp. TaxID=114847 RepID=UPI002624653E|nr:class I SAM-dependent methyltransferase [uncultured Roseobacter sp.]